MKFQFTKQAVQEYAEYLEQKTIEAESKGLLLDAKRARENATSTRKQLQRIESGEVQACHSCKTQYCLC